VEIIANEPVTTFSTQVLQKWHKRLKKRGKQIVTLSPEERHRVRISAKKLRYACEFFSSLYSHKQVRRYLAALTGLQDVLGILNDAATTEQLLQQLKPTDRKSSLRAAKNLVLGWVRGASQARNETLGYTWKQFVKQEVFW
jgi:CHAD domain-containing protein